MFVTTYIFFGKTQITNKNVSFEKEIHVFLLQKHTTYIYLGVRA